MISKEDYEYIAQYRQTYENAAKKNYAKILPRSINERLNEIIGGPKNKNWGCSACCLTLYRNLYRILNTIDEEREQKRQEFKDRMAKAREAKKNKKETENSDG